MPYVSSSGRQFRLDGPHKQTSLMRYKVLLVGAAMVICWVTLGQQGSAAVAAEKFRTLSVPASSFQSSRIALEQTDGRHNVLNEVNRSSFDGLYGTGNVSNSNNQTAVSLDQ